MSLRAAFADAILIVALTALAAGHDRFALLAVIFAAVEASIAHGRGLFGWAWERQA